MDYMEDLSGFQFSKKKLNKPVLILNMTCVTLPSRGNKIKGHAISGLLQIHWGSFNYPYICNGKEGKCRNKHHPKQELNQGPPDLKSSTLPNELKGYLFSSFGRVLDFKSRGPSSILTWDELFISTFPLFPVT